MASSSRRSSMDGAMLSHQACRAASMASGEDGALSDANRSTGCRLFCSVAKGLAGGGVGNGRAAVAGDGGRALLAAGLPGEEICTAVGLLRPPDTRMVLCML